MRLREDWVCGWTPRLRFAGLRWLCTLAIAAGACIAATGASATAGAGSARPAIGPHATTPAAATTPVSQTIIVSPRRGALITRAPVHLVLRIPHGLKHLKITLNGHRVHGRTLSRRDGLRVGLNSLLVRGIRRGNIVVDARTFDFVRRAPALGHLRVRIRSADVNVVIRGHGLNPAHREYTFRVWLNGRDVTRDFDSTHQPTWRARLSVSAGVRPGANRLRVRLVDLASARYLDFTQPFRMPNGVPLAGAGRNRAVLKGTRVRLQGKALGAAPRGRVRYRWTLVGQPRGSRARLRNATALRPTLQAKRLGRYRVRLRVSDSRPRKAVAGSGSSGSTVSQATVTVKPPNPLVPIDTLAGGGVTIGSQTYPDPTPGAMQVLTIDRGTLQVTNGTYTSAAALKAQVAAEGLQQLVIITAPGGGSAPPIATKDVKTFNQALNAMGVASVPAATLTRAGQALSIIGVPRSLAGSGWFSPAGEHGWLAVDSSGSYAFSPQTPAIDTSSASSPSSNTMTIAGQSISATALPGSPGGYQIVALDPYTLKVLASAYFDSIAPNGAAQMGDFLNSQGVQDGRLIAVQSVGNPPGIPVTLPPAAPLEKLGAASPVFSTAGSYAFFGGTALAPSDVLETNSSIVTDPTTNARMGRSLLARAVPRNADGVFRPTTHDFPGAPGAADMNFALYDIVHKPASPWPYTSGGPFPQQPGCGPPGTDTPANTAAYAAALSDIAQGVGLGAYATNLRLAYLQNDQAWWSDEKTDLAGLQYATNKSYTLNQWCNLKAEMQREWDWLDQVHTLFDSYKQPFLRAGPTEFVGLQKIGDAVKNSVHPDGNATVGWDAFSVIGEVANIFSFLPEEGWVGALIDSIQSAYDLSSEFATDGDYSPLPDQVDSKVRALSQQVASQYSDVAASMDNLRDIVISDYGRLSTLGPLAPTQGWAIDTPDIEHVTQQLETGAQAWFMEQLLPIAYKAFILQPSSGNPSPTTANCSVTDPVTQPAYGYTTNFSSEPASGQVALPPRLVALGRGNPDDLGVFDSFSTPPASLTDPLFLSPNQTTNNTQGLGLYAPWFFLRNFSPFGSAHCYATAPG